MARRPDQQIESPVLTFRQACAYLKRGETWLRTHKGEIGYVGTGRPLFERAALDAWLARNRVVTTAVPAPAVVPYQPKPLSLPGSERINPVTQRPYGSAAR